MGGDALWLSSSAGNAVTHCQEPVHWDRCPQWALEWIPGELRVRLSCLPDHLLQSLFHVCNSRRNPHILCFLVQNHYIMKFCAGGRERKELLPPASAMGLASCLGLLIAHCHHPLLQSHPERTGWNYRGSKKPTSSPPIPACPQLHSNTPCQRGPFPHPAVAAVIVLHLLLLIIVLSSSLLGLVSSF